MTKLTSCKDKYKMMNLRFFLATWTLVCTCSALPDIHLQMSPEQLHTVFHVDSVENVPNYELIELLHHTPTLHRVRKRAVDSGSTANLLPHHVKKDLSKTPFFTLPKSPPPPPLVDSSSDSADRNSVSNEIPGVNVNLSDVKEHRVSFTAFGEKVNLNLKPTEGLFKDGPQSLRMWTVHSDPNATQGLNYEEITQDEEQKEEVGHVFQDESKMAAILMRRQLETGDLIMEGSVGHELMIRPLPQGIASPLNSSSVQHVVYRRQSDPMDQLSDFAYMEPDRLQKRYRRGDYANVTRSGRTKRAVPHVIYPEILVIVDHDGYRLHGGDNVQVKRYFVSFWNGVDLRYRLLKGPRIRISIAGIIISRGRDATPYLERNRVGRDAIDSAAALTDMGKYLFRERRLPVYDIAVAITKYDMCRRRKGGRCTKGTAGFAYVGGACVVNKRLEKVNSVAIIEDTGGFSGIIVAAHEVGHLLGAVHDGSPPPSYLGGPGAEKCRWEDGYIMSDLRHTERGFRWSPCSIQSFHHFLNGDTASCLHNAPHEDEALGRALPGTLLSLDAQCRRDRGTSACFKDERVCAQLFCFDAASGYCVAYRPAAEGSSCGDGLHCLDGRCVPENENIIPDYSQHTPSYASPNAYNSPLSTESYNFWDEHSPAQPTTRPPPPPPTFTTTPSTTARPFPSFYQQTTPTTTRAPFTFKFKSFFDTTPVAAPYPPYQWQRETSAAPTYPPFPTTTTTTTTTPPPPPPPPSTTSMYWPFSTKINPFYYGLHNQQNSAPSTPRTTTRNPLFDLYLSRIATTTKNPYNFENFGFYSKSTTKNPPAYLNNFLGSNSNTMRMSLPQAAQTT
ncbi:A disintegrin and metalloproteinase with thrombospondin motifs like isoform X2 [Lutzomyia longipalpis]|uniref:A disintegrin and metalloproteinase with thrombospondin motifs like isoform X2 n=1 Tax=Lutzomyia longipalpis TaxID=7200 RepID=UPI0024839DEF|nr:A disintegrin and metalloproteinase with thrombospondin motifs like isoform X2 [Lutzomyia longipalpis]